MALLHLGSRRHQVFPAAQIGPDNFDQLRVVWRFRPPDQQIYETADLDLDFDEHRGTPIAVNGVLYYASPFNILVALDGASGEELWTFDPEAWRIEPRFLGNLRGVSYWTDGAVERIFLATSTAYLYSIDAKTGLPDPAFGQAGRVDLGASLRRPLTDGDRWNYGVTAPPVICRGVVAVGSAIGDWRGRPRLSIRLPATCRLSTQGRGPRSGSSTRFRWQANTAMRRGKATLGRPTAPLMSGPQ